MSEFRKNLRRWWRRTWLLWRGTRNSSEHIELWGLELMRDLDRDGRAARREVRTTSGGRRD